MPFFILLMGVLFGVCLAQNNSLFFSTVRKGRTDHLASKRKRSHKPHFQKGRSEVPQPQIIPNPTPIVLKLDSNGQYPVTLSDVAKIVYDTTYTLTTTITPQALTCADLGQKTITVTAQLSGANPSAIGFDASSFMLVKPNGDIILADAFEDELRYISHTSAVTTMAAGDGSPYSDKSGVAQTIHGPNGLAMDAQGNLFVVESESGDIVKLTPGGQLSKVKVNDPSLLSQAYGLAVDAAGNLYVSEFARQQIVKIAPDGTTTVLAGSAQQLDQPQGMTVGPDGDLYVADSGKPAIWKITPAGAVTMLNFPKLDEPQNIAIDADRNFYIADPGDMTVKKYDSNFNLLSIVASAKNGLSGPYSVGKDAAGEVFILDFDNYLIYKIDAEGKLTTYAGGGSNAGNGNISGTAGPVVGKDIAVNVVSTMKFNPPLPDQTLTAPSICPVLIADYTMQASVIDYCGKQITYTQTPAPGTSVSNSDPIQVILTATDELGSAVKDTFNLAVNFPKTTLIAFPQNITVLLGNSVQLTPKTVSSDITGYRWQSDPTLSSTTIVDPVATPTVTTTYYLTVTTSEGCPETVPVTVTVLNLGKIPNAFTPNGDGINDTWNIPGLADFPSCEVSIFNRYGGRIFFSTGYARAWDGKLNGKPVPAGTYYYIIAPGSGLPKQTGWVTVIK